MLSKLGDVVCKESSMAMAVSPAASPTADSGWVVLVTGIPERSSSHACPPGKVGRTEREMGWQDGEVANNLLQINFALASLSCCLGGLK